MVRIHRAAPALLFGIASVVGLPDAARAADSAAATAELEEVTVTAEKRSENLQKVAASIQVQTGEDLEKQGKKRIDEIMQGLPGVAARDSQVGNLFFIRGVDAGGGGGTPATAGSTTVSLLIDGAYQSRGETVRGGTLDVSQAEVMRGTQSTNLGANALAGAVSLVTNKPVLGVYQAKVSLETGNYNLFNAEGVANIPLADKHAVRLAYALDRRDGYISNNAGNSDLMNARLKYRYQPSENLDLVFTVGRQVIGGNGVQQGALTYSGVWVPYAAQTAATPGGYLTVLGYPATYGLVATPGKTYKDRRDPWNDGLPKNAWPNYPDRDTKINTYSAEINWTTPYGTLTAIPTVERARLIATEPPRGTGTTFNAQDNTQPTNQVDIHFNSKDDGKLTWLVGAWYYKTDMWGPFMTSSYPPEVPGYGNCGPTNSTPLINNNGSNICRVFTYSKGGLETKSFYGNFSFSLTDALRVKAGVRNSHDDKYQIYSLSRAQGGFDYFGGTDLFSGPTWLRAVTGAPMPGAVTATITGFQYAPFSGYKLGQYDHSWSNTAWSAGVEFDVTPNSMAYAGYQTGYQPGVLNVMGATGTPAAGTAAPAPTFLKENTSKQISVGFKSRWLDNKLQFNIEAFNISRKDVPAAGNNSNLVVVGTPSDPQCQTFAPPTLAANAALGIPQVPYNFSCLAPGAQMVADNRSRGVDIDLNWKPTAADRLDIGFEYLDAVYSSPLNLSGFNVTVDSIIAGANLNRGTNAAYAATDPTAIARATALLNLYNARVASFSGKQLQNASKYSSNLAYEHRFTFGNGSTLAPRLNAEYKSTYWVQGGTFPPSGFGQVDLLDKGSLVRQDGYTLWNVSAEYVTADGKYSLNAYVKNLENKPIMLNIGGEPGVTVNYISLQPPRTFGVVFSARL